MFDDVTTISDTGPRRLVAAILLRACTDAGRGDRGAIRFLESEDSAALARALDIHRWPPSRDMLCGLQELRERKKILNAGEREPSVKRSKPKSGQLDFSSRSTHTSANRTKRAAQVLAAPERP